MNIVIRVLFIILRKLMAAPLRMTNKKNVSLNLFANYVSYLKLTLNSKTMKAKILLAPLLVTLLAIMIGFSSFASQNDDLGKKDKGKKRHNKELRKELKAYIDQNVMPALREQRNKLESKITLQDRQKLEELRKQLAVLQAQRHDFRKDFRKEQKGATEKGEMTEEQRNKIKEVRDKIKIQMKTIMQSSKEIAKNYSTDIEQLLTPMQSQKEQWKQDMKAICDKYTVNNPDSTHKHGGNARGKHGKHGKFRMMAKQHFKEMKPAMFLLIQPSENQVIATEAVKESDENTKIYPNPSSNQTTSDFKVKEAGNVNIVLLDAQGNVIKNIMNEHKEKGKYSALIDLSGLREGTYFYKIATPTKTETNRVVVK